MEFQMELLVPVSPCQARCEGGLWDSGSLQKTGERGTGGWGCAQKLGDVQGTAVLLGLFLNL